MNILIKYSVLKYMFSHIRFELEISALFRGHKPVQMLKKYKNGFCSEILYFNLYWKQIE